MSCKYTELVVEGPFILVKGFLIGFWSTRAEAPHYFIHRKAGIRRHTLRDFMVELFELENMVHLCLEDGAVLEFIAAVEKAGEAIGIQLRSQRRILGASFNFSYEIYNRHLADECRTVLDNLPEGVELEGYAPVEEMVHDAGAELSAGYAPEHVYAIRGKGGVSGDFDGVINLYRRIKQSEAAQFILTGEVDLTLEEPGDSSPE